MNEAAVVRKIKKEIEKRIPAAIVLKHADLATAGIPDLSVTYNGRTHWVEVKLLKDHETRSTFRKHIDRLQAATARRLEHQGLCTYFVAYPLYDTGLHAALFSPLALDNLAGRSAFDIGNMGLGKFNGFFDHTLDQLIYLIKGVAS